MAQTHIEQDTIFLCQDDFRILINTKRYLNLEIIKDNKIKEIGNAKKPTFYFYIEKRKYIAKGIEFAMSYIPEKCDYFYSLGVKGEVLHKNILYLNNSLKTE